MQTPCRKKVDQLIRTNAEGKITSQCVFQHVPAHNGCDSGRSSHARTGVDLNQPRLTVFREHEIGAVQFERALRNIQTPACQFNSDWPARQIPQDMRRNMKSGTGSGSSHSK